MEHQDHTLYQRDHPSPHNHIIMDSESEKLKIFFLPFFSAGHMIPMVDEARVFAKHGVDVTIIATEANAVLFQNNIDRDFNAGHRIRTHILQFPSAQVGLPHGIENLHAITSMEMLVPLYQGYQVFLRQSIEHLIREMRPDCIVSDMFFPWTLDVANELRIPRLAFRGTNYFSLCAEHCVRTYQPHKNSINSHAGDAVLLPGFPHKIEMLISQLPDWLRTTTLFTSLMETITEAEQKSYGILMNSFHELEKAYEEHFQTAVGLKSWSTGPVSLWANLDVFDKTERCKISGGGRHEKDVVDWLDSKAQNSVLYVSFGGLTKLAAAQLNEIAHGLENSGHPFIWVVRKKDGDEYEEVFPDGFEERMKESKKGFIIKGWAPQMVILDHPATGGMVTHCGWNSILEGLNSGLPMITWPLFAEQFFNEKLLVDVLRIGVSVGVKEWRDWGQEGGSVVKREEVEKAVRLLMDGGEEAGSTRNRARKLQAEAKKAVEIGGSSYSSLMALIDELQSLKKMKN